MKMHSQRHVSRLGMFLIVLLATLLAACGGGGGSTGGSSGGAGSGDWYYHWSCNGDAQCLATNPTGASSGTLNEGPVEANCSQLLTFAAHFWGGAATNSCDQSAAGPSATLKSLAMYITAGGTIDPGHFGPKSIPVGATGQFKVIGTYSDGSYSDLSSQFTWSPADNCVASIGTTPAATVSGSGLVTGTQVGSFTICGKYNNQQVTLPITVVAPQLQSLAMTPVNPTLGVGQTRTFTIVGTFTDGSTQALNIGPANEPMLTSSSSAVASFVRVITSQTSPTVYTYVATAKALSTGQTTLTASYQSVYFNASTSTTLTVQPAVLVSLNVHPAAATLAKGYSRKLTAVGTYSDGTSKDLSTQVTWQVTGTGVTIAADGTVAAAAVGGPSISATMGSLTGSSTLSVNNATLQSISITPSNPVMASGTAVQMTATGHFSDGNSMPLISGLAWGSQTTSTGTITQTGLISSQANGTSTITASASGITGNTTLTVASKPPGTNWVVQSYSAATAPCGNPLYKSIAWSGSLLVAVGPGSDIMTSTDGTHWTAQVGSACPSYNSVVWVADLGLFVAAGSGIATSPDGSTWTTQSTTTGLADVAWLGNQLIAVGASGTVMTSPDGVHWTAQASGTTNQLNSIAYTGVQYVAAGNVTLVSPDGVTWTAITDTSSGWTGLAWSGSTLVETNQDGTVRTSSDGVTWTSPVNIGASGSLSWTGTQFLALNQGGDIAYTSQDGVTWSSHSMGTASLAPTMYSLLQFGNTVVSLGHLQYVGISQ